MQQKKALKTAGWIFLGVALLHALRVLLRVRVTVQDFTIPQNFSVFAVVVLIVLAGWMFHSAK
jgi:hypothetical protein